MRQKWAVFEEFSVNLQLKIIYRRMKRKFFAFILLLTAGLSLSSCLSSDDDVTIEYTHDTAITAFSLGTLTRTYAGVSSKTGKDTTYTAEVTGSNYKFLIDQANRKIYNEDSLPVGTKTSAVLATISSKQSSPIVLQDINKPDSLIYYSSSDSIDFSKPRQVRVYNNDLTAYATYTITVNVHQEEQNAFVWHSLTNQQNGNLAALDSLKAVSLGEYIYVFGKTKTDNGECKIYKTRSDNGATWDVVTPHAITFATDAYKSAIAFDGELYILNNGSVLKSTNGEDWQAVATDADVKQKIGTSLTQLIGASSKYLFAYTATGIAVSKDKGTSWDAESLDMDAEYLPTQNLSLITRCVRSTKDAENLLLIGCRDTAKNDTIATLWTRTLDYTALDGQWNYVEYVANQKAKLPYLDCLQVAANDSGYVAFGAGKFPDGTTGCKWYKSHNGLAWKVDTTVVAPTGYTLVKPMAFARDNNNFYWVINNGHVWKGRYNRDGWRKE